MNERLRSVGQYDKH